MKKMPILFVGHGNPMNAIEDNEFSRAWSKLGKEIGKPKVVVAISAHWVTEGTVVTGNEKPPKINDFYGFPEELYEKKYEVEGSIATAKNVIKHLSPQFEVKLDSNWGIDHGAWSVLSRMYPKADVPVIQIGLHINKSAEEHWKMAKLLAALRDENILILGSGNIVHNLRMAQWNEEGFSWAEKFDENVKNLINKGDIEKLIDYKKILDWELAIPTNEHYLPMLYTLASKKENEKIDFRCEKVTMGSVSMRSFLVI